jgi:alkaline phosphatase
MYQKAIELVKSYIDSRDDSIMISVSDHETGGLVLAKQPTAAYPAYKWNPKALQPVTSSSINLALQISLHAAHKLHRYINNHLTKHLGFTPTSENIDVIYEHANDPAFNDKYIAELVNEKAEIAWGTHGHSAVDVNLYAHGLEMEKLRGNKENIEIGMFIEEYLGVGLKEVTEALQDGRTKTEMRKVKDVEGGFKQLHFHHAVQDFWG